MPIADVGTIIRPRDESKEERRARKLAMKEDRKVCCNHTMCMGVLLHYHHSNGEQTRKQPSLHSRLKLWSKERWFWTVQLGLLLSYDACTVATIVYRQMWQFLVCHLFCGDFFSNNIVLQLPHFLEINFNHDCPVCVFCNHLNSNTLLLN